MKIRVQTSVGDVYYHPCVHPFVGFDSKLHLFIRKSLIKRHFYPEIPFDHLEFSFDWSDDVDALGISADPPRIFDLTDSEEQLLR